MHAEEPPKPPLPSPSPPPGEATTPPSTAGRKTTWPKALNRILSLTFLLGIALAFASALLRSAGIAWGERLGLVAFFTCLIPGSLFFIIVICGGSWMALRTTTKTAMLLPRTLFLRARFRLGDLVLLVALLGNTEGLILAHYLPTEPESGISLGLLAALWILGGFTWGVWTATRLNEEHWGRRWFLLLSGLSVPLIPACLFFSAYHLWSAVSILRRPHPTSEDSPLLHVLQGLLALVLAFLLTRHTLRLHRAAASAAKAGKDSAFRDVA